MYYSSVIIVYFFLLTSNNLLTGISAENEVEIVEPRGQTTCGFKNGSHSILHTVPINVSNVFAVDGHMFISQCNFCFTLWEGDSPQDQKIISQGCWLNHDGCSESECVMTKIPEAVKELDGGQGDKFKFCCCVGNDCNNRFTKDIKANHLDQSKLSDRSKQEAEESSAYLSEFYIPGLAVSVMCSIFIYLYRRLLRKKFESVPNSSDLESCPLAKSSMRMTSDDLSSVTLESILGQGKYGVVYKGQLKTPDKNETVAVKVFSAFQKKAFQTEQEIYQLSRLADPLMTSSILQYFGSEENKTIDNVYYDSIIVVSCAEKGSLLSFLKGNTVSWPELCRMLQDIARGLSALHSGFQNPNNYSEKKNPSICHRDFNSRNILVRSDLSCCIADFGFALRVQGSVIFQNGIQLSAEAGSLSDVGTIRYLAPELLDGALNLSDCESALKQIDIYALGLVFWELSRRCRDLYQGANIYSFEQAFERELGCLSPSFDQMKLLVSRNRARPLFPEVWKNSNPAIQQLKETIEDSWDHDGEARLTALCILERIRELPLLWDRYKLTIQGPQTIEASPQPCNNIVANQDANVAKPCVFLNNDIGPRKGVDVTQDKNVSKNDNVLSRQQPVAQIQPYQGKNPCMERNLMIDGDSSEAYPLVEKSSKEMISTRRRQADDGTQSDAGAETSGAPAQLLEASRMGQNSRHLYHTIPYVKNDFSSVDSNRCTSQTSLNKTTKKLSFWSKGSTSKASAKNLKNFEKQNPSKTGDPKKNPSKCQASNASDASKMC